MIIKEKNCIINLFEQSGTFKKIFNELGFKSVDVDIENKFNETNYIIDLFNVIDNDMLKDLIPNQTKLIMCFFPCVRFSTQATLLIKCKNYGFREFSDIKKLDLSMKYERERSKNYERLCKIIKYCLYKNIRLVVENPCYQNYLLNTLPFEPNIIDTNRSLHGDYYIKPTMYYLFNFRNDFTLISEMQHKKIYLNLRNVVKENGIERSLISKEYAKNFIHTYILPEVQDAR